MNRNNYYGSGRIPSQMHDLLHQYLLLRQGAMAGDASVLLDTKNYYGAGGITIVE